jgi:ferredoxin-NADP reductase
VYKCKVKKIVNGNNVKSIIFEKPLNFFYLPGHFVMLSIKNKEGFVKRAFSLSSSPSEKILMITAKLNSSGTITPYLFNDLNLNDEILIEGPYGKMFFDEKNEKIKNVIMISAGTGFAPMRSIMKYIYDKKIDVKVNLYYSTKTFESILFYDDIKDFIKSKNFNIEIYLTQEKYDHFKNNRIENNDFFIDEKGEYFLCGPKDFVLDKVKFLKSKNIKNIKFEAW